jgi:hypothetical protein
MREKKAEEGRYDPHGKRLSFLSFGPITFADQGARKSS